AFCWAHQGRSEEAAVFSHTPRRRIVAPPTGARKPRRPLPAGRTPARPGAPLARRPPWGGPRSGRLAGRPLGGSSAAWAEPARSASGRHVSLGALRAVRRTSRRSQPAMICVCVVFPLPNTARSRRPLGAGPDGSDVGVPVDAEAALDHLEEELVLGLLVQAHGRKQLPHQCQRRLALAPLQQRVADRQHALVVP
ncbi:unnamed protein product, partial [Prorocentrum cordatum]